MSLIIDFLIPRIEILGSIIYWIIFLASFFESFAFVGYIIPGTALMVFSGVLISQGSMHMSETLLVIFLGGVLGDAASFYIGKQSTQLFAKQNKIFKQDYLDKGEEFFKKHGNKSIFLARFFGPVRPMVPFVAGVFRMSAKTFFIYNITSALLASPLYVCIGYFFGQHAKKIEHVVGRAGLLFVFLGILVGGLYMFKRSLVKKGSDFFPTIRLFIASVLKFIIIRPRIEYFLEHHKKGVNFLRQRTNTLNLWGLPLTLCILMVVILLVAAGGLFDNLVTAPWIVQTDRKTEWFLFVHRNRFLVHLFWFITYFASVWVVPCVVVAASIMMWFKKRFQFIVPLCVVMVGSAATGLLLKHIIARPRPTDFSIYRENLFSFPSLHSMVALVLYGFLAYFFIRLYKNWATKLNIIFLFVVFVFLIGFSRLYLGVHFLSDVVVGYALGILWLWIGISLVRVMQNNE